MSEVSTGTSYTPGTWFAVVGEHATVLLPPTEKSRAGALWALVDDGAGFDEVLDELVSAGLRNLPGFVLVADEGDTTRVVVRGDAVASFETADGPVDVEGSGTSTWAERSLVGVTRMTVSVGEENDDPAMVFTGGLVRVSRLEVPPAVRSPAAEVDAVQPALQIAPEEPGREEPEEHEEPHDLDIAAAPMLSLVTDDPLNDPLAREHVEEHLGEPDEEPDEEPHEKPDERDSDLAPGFPPPPAPAFPPPPPAAPPPAPYAPPALAWGTPPPPPEAPEEPAAEPFGAFEDEGPDDDHDGLTRVGAPGAEFERQQPGIPGQPAAPNVTAFAVARLEFSSGDRVDVDRVVLVGRAPEAGRFSQSEQPLLVTVPSPHQEISSTHCEIRPGTGVDHGAAIVTDLGSTNGTVLVQPGLGPEELRPGVPVQIIPGAVIDLGDGLTIRVSHP